ncbi:MAG: hypothetical protein KAT23_01260 [Anaerolineales bacterium]|nr:hypothetical protein [Anaerolineales bacterium]
MNRQNAFMIVTLVLMAACTTPPSPTEAPTTIPTRPKNTPPPTATTIVTPSEEAMGEVGYPGLPLPFLQGELFSTSGACAVCHTRLIDDTGADVSIDAYWRSTIMANAARDPYWQASVRAEVLDNPDLTLVIEDKCATCHMPMAHSTLLAIDEQGEILDNGFVDPENELHTLAMDGVSCSLCHQIRETGLGLSSSYSGGFIIDTELRSPNRVIFGPYTIGNRQARIMQDSSGFRPEQGLHISGSELCASCHTLYTPYIDASGEIAGEFPEQVPYFEWFYSDYRRTQTCQDCHMPEADGGVKISTMSQVLRSPFAQHTFVGGNAYMLRILETFSEDIEVTASSEQFEATIGRTLEQLETGAATIEFGDVRLSGSRLITDVVIENLAGHKFPTGFPARRAWIHFTVRDASGEMVFESGAFNPDGSIVENDNDADPGAFEQHYLAIVQPEQVQIYETVLQDTENRVSTNLLRAARYLKDNRLLPSGFEKAAQYEDIAVRGGAREDDDFQGGGDEIQYIVSVGSAEGPFTVTVELLYQSIGYRWAENLRRYDAPEIDRFIGYYDAVPNQPVVVSHSTVEVGD